MSGFVLLVVRSSHWKFFVKKMFLKISQNQQKSLAAVTLLKKILRHRSFHVHFVKFSRERLRSLHFHTHCIYINLCSGDRCRDIHMLMLNIWESSDMNM